MKCPVLVVAVALAVVLAVGGLAPARIVVRAAPAGSNISLPYNASDSQGNRWMIYPGGWVQVQGNQPLYGQAANLQINGANPNQRNNRASQDPKTGEIIFDNLSVNGFTVTRRILIDKDDCLARYVDIIHNDQAQDQTAQVQIQSNVNFGIDGGTTIEDPRHKGSNIGWSTGNNNGRAIFEMMAGKGSKVVPTFNFQQGNTWIQSNYSIPIPAHKSVALVHLHGICASPEQATQFVDQFKEHKLLAALPAELRKEVVNFASAQDFIGDRELLRGDLFDVVEIRGGDQMRGTIKLPSYKLQTFYGDVELPASSVIGMFNVGQYRPRQLLVTSDGQIFGGKLAQELIPLELTSGQVTNIPLSQVSRLGYRKRPGEPEEWTFTRPFVALRSGDRIDVQMPAEPIAVDTRYGALKLDPKSIAAIVFQNEDSGVHEIHLTDGSHFAGLASAPSYEMKLAGEPGPEAAGGAATQPAPASSDSGGATGASGGAAAIPSQQIVHFPASAIARIQLAANPDDPDENQTATMKLVNDDLLVGTLSGQLKLDTAFDTLTLDGAQVRKLESEEGSSTDVQVTMWDGSMMSGQLEDPQVQCRLGSGITISVPVALVDAYNQPQPEAGSEMTARIKATVAQLNADDWKTRDRAQRELAGMGNIVVAELKALRPNQPPEAQERIDQILAGLEKKK